MRKTLLLSSALLLGACLAMNAAVKVEKTNYDDWPNCYRISNGEVELIVTTDVGPRVMRYAFVGGENVFAEFKEQLGKSGEKEWKSRGGHRLWAAPEDKKDTYALDNGPVKATVHEDGITLTQPVEPETGLRKEITVKLAASGGDVEVNHRITNTRGKSRRLAAWALTQMAPGGMGIAAFPPRGSHEEYLSPTNPLTMWAYTDFSDKRWTFTKKYVVLKNDPNVKQDQKTGLYNPHTFAAYLNGTTLFVKQATAEGNPDQYVDFGCSYETYTNDQFLEMETLGQLTDVGRGKSVSHTEHWSIHKDVSFSGITDEELDRVLKPLMK